MNDTVRSVSPSGRFRIVTDPWEPRMSQWIQTPRILDDDTGSVLFSLVDPRWSMDDLRWESEDIVRLLMRKYPGDRRPLGVAITIYLSDLTAEIEGSIVPLSRAELELEAALG